MVTATLNAGDEQACRPDKSGAQAAVSLWRLVPLLILAYSVLLPLEMRLVLGGQVIYPSRAAIFLLAPWILRELALGQFKARWPDFLLFFAGAWMIVSFIAVYGAVDGVLRGGALTLDLVGPYLVARLSIRSIDDFRRLLVFLAPAAFLAGASLFVESITGTPIIRPLASQIFGDLPRYEGGAAIGERGSASNFRFGLLRASGPFSHAIYAGLFLSSLLPLYAYSGLLRWPRKIGLATAAFSMFSVSSAAILGILLSGLLLAADKVQQLVQSISWKIMVAGGMIGLLFIQFASQNGLIPILIRMTLNPQTGYYRLIIWRFGVESVERNPLFGIGFAVYERPVWMNTSVDSYWLLLAIRHGLAAPVSVLLVSIAAMIMLGFASARLAEQDRRTLVSIAIAIACLVTAGFTVAFIGGILTWFVLILGSAISLSRAHDI